MNRTLLGLRKLRESDWKYVSGIYKEGIETGNATFEQNVPNWKDWHTSHIESCRIVAELNDIVAGWAALSQVSSRCVYGGVAEVSVYVSGNFTGKQIGTKLLNELIKQSELHNIWTLQAGVFPENKASLRIHEKLGFRNVGYRERIGKMNGVWRDTILLERRSKIVGE